MLRIALPNKGTLAEPAATMMREAGYRQRNDNRDLSMLDEENDIEFFYLRPKDIATYVGSGDLQLGITGADLMDESGSQVRSVLPLGFGQSKFRFAAPDRGIDGREWKLEDLEGKKIATSYPRLVRAHLARSRVRADIIKLDGAVEISVQLNLADAIADVVSSGRTLRQHNLVAFGDPIAESEATLIEREPRPDREETVETEAGEGGLHRAAARRRLRPASSSWSTTTAPSTPWMRPRPSRPACRRPPCRSCRKRAGSACAPWCSSAKRTGSWTSSRTSARAPSSPRRSAPAGRSTAGSERAHRLRTVRHWAERPI